MSVYDVEVTLVVESDHTEILNPSRWMSTGVKDPAETGTALVSTLNQIIAFGTNRRGNIAAERFKQFSNCPSRTWKKFRFLILHLRRYICNSDSFGAPMSVF